MAERKGNRSISQDTEYTPLAEESAPSDLRELAQRVLDTGDLLGAIALIESALAAERTRCIETALRMAADYNRELEVRGSPNCPVWPTVESVLAELERTRSAKI